VPPAGDQCTASPHAGQMTTRSAWLNAVFIRYCGVSMIRIRIRPPLTGRGRANSRQYRAIETPKPCV